MLLEDLLYWGKSYIVADTFESSQAIMVARVLSM